MTCHRAFRFLPGARCLLPTVFLLLTVHCSLLTVTAQSTSATLSGTVEDTQGAVVPNVTVAVLNLDTSLQRQTITDESGSYVFVFLPPGRYRVTAEGKGFAKVQIENVVLNVGDQKALQIQLKAGNISEMVQITNDAPLIDTSPAVGTVVDRQFVENIPLNGRSFQSLIALTPGVTLVAAPVAANTGGQFSVNGQRPSANSFMVDGVSANFAAQPGFSGLPNTTGNLPGLTTFGTTQSLVSVDALEEFKVQTSGYSAAYGRQPGGQISIATRSGTNDFHGSLFDYLRNDVFDANDWFANANRQPKPPMRQNDFGGTFSGPVLLPGYNGSNRTFFFFSYEGLRLNLPKFSLTNVPTLALRQQAPVGLQPILNAFPLPNGADLGNGLAEFRASYSDPSSLDATSIRIDHAINSKVTIFGRYNKAPSKTINRGAEFNLSLISNSKLDAQTLTVGLISAMSARATNDLRVNYSGNSSTLIQSLDDFGGASPISRGVVIPTQYNAPTAQASITLLFPGRTSGSVITLAGAVTDQQQINIVDNFSYRIGSHEFKIGVDYRRLTPTIDVNPYFLNIFFMNSQQVLAGTAGVVQIFARIPSEPIIINFSGYINDTWRASSRLTFNFGMRWEVNPAPTEKNGNEQPAVTQIDNLATMDLAPLGTKAWKTTFNNLAPRIGLAYQLSQRPGQEMILRGGFGVFYDSGNDFGGLNYSGFPYFAGRTITNVGFPLTPTNSAPPPLPIQTGLTPPYRDFMIFDPNLKLPYTLQWNLAGERSLGANQTLTVSYVGAAGKRLLQGRQLVLSQLNPRFSFPLLVTNKATSDYHALQTSFQRRLSRGFQALVSYTWSHAIDEDSSSRGASIPQRGNAAFDVRHVFAAAATYDIPTPVTSRIGDALLGGWSVDTSIRAQSALPVNLVASSIIDPVTGSFTDVQPNVVSGTPIYLDDPNVPGGRRINRAAFSVPPAGQQGNLGRNQLRGLPAWQMDLSLRRNFKLREKLRLQFQAQAFNVFNHPNFGAIQTTLSATNFGQATNMLNRQLGGMSQLYQIGGPRSMQFALKLLF